MARKGYTFATRLKALRLVAMGLSDADVGAQVRISVHTIRRWRNDPRHTQILIDCQRELIDTMEENAKLAALHLRGVLTDATEDPSRQMIAAIQSLKAHSRAVAAAGVKQIGDAAERMVTAKELEEKRYGVLERLAKANPTVKVIDGAGDDPIH